MILQLQFPGGLWGFVWQMRDKMKSRQIYGEKAVWIYMKMQDIDKHEVSVKP